MKKFFFVLFSFISLSFFSQTLSTSLTACYALNGNGIEPINSLNGTLSAAASPTVDRFNNTGSAVHFNGTAASFITLPNSPLLKPSNAVSFSAWVKFDNIIQSHYIVFAHNTCTSYHEGYTLVAQNLGPGFKLHAVKSSGACSAATQQVLSSSSNMLANTWYHVGGYIGNDSLKIYINGVLEGSAISINPSFNYNPGENVYLGGSNIAFNLPMNGSLDNVRFYNRKLSGTEFNQLYLVDPVCSALTPNCNNVFYSSNIDYNLPGFQVNISSTGIPNSSTLSPLSTPSSNIGSGFAIGPAFGFPAPNPTFWCTVGGNYAYYNGSTFVNTNHPDIPGSGTKKYGGSKNFIYSLDQIGQVYAYNGTGTASLITSVPTSSNGVLNADIVGDDLDNFYILKLTSPQSLLVYNSAGVQLCSYSINGIPTNTTLPPGGGLAIVGNTVSAYTHGSALTNLFYNGLISGSTINFTLTPQTYSLDITSDFASCPITTSVFSSSITASPNPSISCISQTITLTANSTATNVPGSYAWSGPGILTSTSSQSVQVNLPGVYTCTMISCPIAGSIASFTVLSGGAPVPTPTITSTNSLSCTSSTSTLSVLPNTATYVFLWAGPGTLSLFTSSSTVINTGGTFSVTVTNISSGCSATQTINIASSIVTLTITAAASNSQVCLPSAPITLTAAGATNYSWTPLGSTLPATGSIVVSNPTTTTVYTVTGSTGACTGSTTVIVNVNSTPILTVSGNPIACSGSPTTLSVSGASSYTWQPGNLTGSSVTVSPTSTTTYTIIGANGNCTATAMFLLSTIPSPTISPSASPTIICQGSTSTLSAIGAITYTWLPGSITGSSITVSPLVTTIYTVSGTNILGCSSSSTIQLVVDNPTISISPLSASVCIGQPATLSAAGATSYTWSPVASNASSIVVTPTTSTTYTLISTDGVCSSTNTIPISVAPLPTITAVSNFTAICDGSSAILTASGANTYTWNPVALFGTTISVSPTVTTTYVVAGTSSLGCINANTVSVVVNANPTITASSNPTIICSGFPSLLTASGASNYTWSPSGANGSTLVVTPSVTSTYTVDGANVFGCVSSQTVSVIVSPTPTLTITASPTVICNGSSATLIALGAGTYTWQPGALTGSSVVVSPTATTVYTVVGVSGICNSTKTFTLVVLPRPNINVTVFPPVICNGGAALLAVLPLANSYTWNPVGTNGNTLVVTPSVTSTYTVIGTNSVGCTNTAVTTVSVNPTATIITIASSTLVCSGTSVTLSSSGGLTYIVNPGALVGPVNVVSPSVTTTYTITGVNNFGCTATNTVTVTVLPSPLVNATSSGTLLCDGGSFSLSATGAVNYTWMPINVSGASIVTTATNAIGVYTVFGEGSNGCISSSTLAVFVINCNNSVFGMTKAAGKPVLVYNTFYNVDFTVTAVNASSLSLSAITLNEDLAAAFISPTNFTVINQPVVTSQNSSLSINPLFDGVSQISLTSPSASTLLPNKRDTIVFTVRVDPKGFYGPFKNWVIGFATVLNNVTVMDTSNNGFAWDPDHDGDPTNDDTVTVINFDPINLFIPDAFSPNGDGKNDVFFIKGLSGRSVKLTVFNRWGNKVYEKSDYDNSWNAFPNVTNTLGSDKVPPATYYYILQFLDGDKETSTGYIVIQY